MNQAFQWIPFYEALADGMLSRSHERSELFNIIKDLADQEPLMSYLHFDQEEWWKARNYEIDPFTIFGIINRSLTDQNRTSLAGRLAEVFSVQAPLPIRFEGIPILNFMNAIYNGIDEIWTLFAEALKVASSNTFTSDFEKFFDKAKAVHGNGLAYITMGLFWIRPNFYMPLDSNSRTYISKKYNLQVKNSCTGKEYVQFLLKLKSIIQQEDSAISLPNISLQAWLDSKGKIDVDPPKPPAFEKDKRYWWLNANPKIWSFSERAVGEKQSYTLLNENGNKRRVYQNFLDARAGDLIIGYESNPVKKIVALCKVTADPDGERMYFEKVESLVNPIRYETLKSYPELANMEYFLNPNGSLFKLTKAECDFIMDMIREENPVQSPLPKQSYGKEDFLSEVFLSKERYDSLVAVLKNKKNIILQGAPGVGKTFAATRLAYSIMGEKNDERVEFIQFHQNYSYEDFVMGYKPDGSEFILRDGVFYQFCTKAENQPDKAFFFIIDEINRGNISKIFGELLMLIEKDYRGKKIKLAYSEKPFSVPENVYIIGLMNTADRSLAMIDYALRRRFSFFEMEPGFDSEGFRNYLNGLGSSKLNSLVDKLKTLNNVIASDPSLGKGFCIGHSYLCGQTQVTNDRLRSIVEYDILPMLSEYWWDDVSKVQQWENTLKGVFNE